MHRQYQEDVKAGLYSAMGNEEVAEYLLRQTLMDNGEQAAIELL